ncbi:MAG: 16S rRNA (guanine(966)-N(2))-methyltransferase RsmD [Candidatus Latescibacteria bacterium]|nr:16S rRNA (guanine(966)-N(2))-methyltransferase RsmD [Candidatus Latescibacterota bacterium]
MLRVIGGRLKGARLKTPKGLATRPVQAKVREALFSILGDMDGVRFLDLFAGTGAVGIEALSRGASDAVFVESGARQCRIIRENLASVGSEARVFRSDTIRALKRLESAGCRFDIVFADPPYETGLSQETVSLVCSGPFLSGDALLALTVYKTESLPGASGGCETVFDRSYGDTRLVVYRNGPSTAS